jgi:succinate dehydrogenase / fumarate reductase cytochrome b subunit
LTSDRKPNMPARTRPLSPHLSIYRWQIGNSLSILHRLTGVALAVGLLALTWWLISVAAGDESYRMVHLFYTTPIGLLLLSGWTFAFFYHLLNGVRHLFWDIGWGFERRERHLSGWLVVLVSLVLTIGVWSLLWRGVHP